MAADTASPLFGDGFEPGLRASQQRRAAKPPPRRHVSLSTILGLQSYTFLKDVADPNLPSGASRLNDAILLVDEASSRPASSSGAPPTGYSRLSTPGAQDRPDSPFCIDEGGALQWQPGCGMSNIIAVSSKLPVAMRRSTWSLKDYNVTSLLHQGYASNVFDAKCKRSGERVALKVYGPVANMEEIPKVQLAREIRLHASLSHPNVVKMHAAFFEEEPCATVAKDQEGRLVVVQGVDGEDSAGSNALGSAGSQAAHEGLRDAQSEFWVVIVTEYVDSGDLRQFARKQGGRLTEKQCADLVITPVLGALHYLHVRGIVHRDLKPENLFLSETMDLELGDFGLAVDVREERANTRAGTLDYMAPEVLMCPTKKGPQDNKFVPHSPAYTTSADVWALGAMLYELLVGMPPFRGSTTNETARNIVHGAALRIPSRISPEARAFMCECMDPDPLERPTVVDLQRHPFLRTMEKMRRQSSLRFAARRSNSFIEAVMYMQQGGGYMPGMPGMPGMSPRSPNNVSHTEADEEGEEEEEDPHTLSYI